MGGGGGYGFSPLDKGVLEEKAKEAIQKAGAQKRRNVFISFSHEDMNEVNLLRGQSKNDSSDFEFSDYSVKESINSENADYIKRKIREKIEKASVTMIYLSNNSINSEWVRWEIEQSIKMKKGIIAVHKGDFPPPNLPDYIAKNASKTVKWEHRSISDAIEFAAEKRSD